MTTKKTNQETLEKMSEIDTDTCAKSETATYYEKGMTEPSPYHVLSSPSLDDSKTLILSPVTDTVSYNFRLSIGNSSATNSHFQNIVTDILKNTEKDVVAKIFKHAISEGAVLPFAFVKENIFKLSAEIIENSDMIDGLECNAEQVVALITYAEAAGYDSDLSKKIILKICPCDNTTVMRILNSYEDEIKNNSNSRSVNIFKSIMSIAHSISISLNSSFRNRSGKIAVNNATNEKLVAIARELIVFCLDDELIPLLDIIGGLRLGGQTSNTPGDVDSDPEGYYELVEDLPSLYILIRCLEIYEKTGDNSIIDAFDSVIGERLERERTNLGFSCHTMKMPEDSKCKELFMRNLPTFMYMGYSTNAIDPNEITLFVRR